jgi:hypothetical protein
MIKIAETAFYIANLVRIARRIVLAIHSALLLREACVTGVIARFIRITRLYHRIRAIGEAQVSFGIAPEISGTRVIRIART